MIHTIQNELLKVSASDFGAELNSIVSGGMEYLWQGDAGHWQGRAPILFPIVGKLKGGAMLYDGNKYIMKNHGICRDATFVLADKADDSLTFSLRSSEETKKVYPFDFELLVTYKLEGQALSTTLRVTNRYAMDIFFSIGGHPAFNCPLTPGEAFEDYEIVLNEKEIQGNRLLNQDGLISNKTAPFFNDSSIIPMDYGHFHRHGTLVFKNLNSTEATLRSKRSGIGVTLGFEGFQYFAVWTKQNAPFICLEPWQGICDSSFYNGNFRGKTGTVQLQPNAAYECKFTITPKQH
ncbi:MAG: aldose 1-epimerase family protein [Oscillospiraceae bacterium]|nr:aldose 1-epimerase family protein [Oscillospiraceae bacterium]